MKTTMALLLSVALLSLCGCISSQDSYCYDQGVKFGRCAMTAFKGKKCDPSDDIVIPSECRSNPETDRGIKDGGRSVW